MKECEVLIKVAICDSDCVNAGNIETLVSGAANMFRENIEVEYFMCGGDLLSSKDENCFYRIVYINVGLNDMSGIELAKTIRQNHSCDETLLIFMSTSGDVDSEIFEVQPFFYISLPYYSKDFLQKFYHAIFHIQKSNDYFVCRKNGVVYQLRKRDIICLESMGHDIVLSSLNKDDIVYRGALKQEHSELTTINFIRPHNSFIVNLDHVSEYRSNSLLMKNGKVVYISELRTKEIKKSILEFWEYRNTK